MRRRPPGSAPPAESPYTAALRMLGRRDLTRAEVTSRLLERGHPPEAVSAAVDRLTETGAIDDRRTALAYVRTATRVKGRGRLRIQRELEAKGVPKTLAREALAEIPHDEDARAIEQFVRKKAGRPDRDTPAGRRRLFQQLLRRGFSAEMISKVLREVP